MIDITCDQALYYIHELTPKQSFQGQKQTFKRRR